MTIGWGILGCGRIADRRIAPAIKACDNARLVAFCSRDLSRAADFADRHNADRGYDRIADLIDDPQVQAVYVATPNALHAEQSIALLKGGKHVLCDKPLAVSAESAEEMIAAADSAGRNLGVAHQMRYLPGVRMLADLVADGQLGSLTLLRASFGFEFPPADAWRQSEALAGGGPLMDLGPHAIDVLRLLAGEVVSAVGSVANVRFRYAVEDTASALLRFADGAVGVLDVGYSYADATLAVFGSEGRAELRGAFGQSPEWALTVTVGGETTRQEGRAERAYADQIEDFSAAVEAGDPAPVPAVEGLRGLEVIEAIYESADAGEIVVLEE